jgi:hypothetical protein
MPIQPGEPALRKLLQKVHFFAVNLLGQNAWRKGVVGVFFVTYSDSECASGGV